MKAWIITNGPKLTTEDTAYLVGRLAIRCQVIYTTSVDLSAREAPVCPGDIDIIVNRVRVETPPDFYYSLQELAESIGVPLTNPGDASIRCNDKRTFPADYPGMVPPTIIASNEAELKVAFSQFDGDIVVKAPRAYGGREVHRIRSDEELVVGKTLLEQTSENEIVVQPFFRGFAEGDRRILTVRDASGGHQVIGALLRTPRPGEWKCNITSGGKGSIYKPTDAEIQFAQQVAHLSGLDYMQSDFGWHDGNLFLIETNQAGGGYVDFDFGNRAKSGDSVAAMIERLATGHSQKALKLS